MSSRFTGEYAGQTGTGSELSEAVTLMAHDPAVQVFAHWHEKSNSKQDYDNVLELLFTNAEVNGKRST